MRQVIIIDSTVLLNVLDIPSFNQSRDAVFDQLDELISSQQASLLLPIACIIEVGNHIAQISDGRQRRRFAQKFADAVREAIDGKAPWTPTQIVDLLAWRDWLTNFPDCAMRGLGMADLSIIKEWEAACSRHPLHRVRVWSLDTDLHGYDRAGEDWADI